MIKKDVSLDFLTNPAHIVAPRLLGCILERVIDDRILLAKIVETEAYDETDAASHSFKGRTPRTDIMFGPAGHLYVYFTYGMHYCCNVVTGKPNDGSAVLIRAVEPLEGSALMEQLRGKSGLDITNGPAKLCQAMGIDKQLNGHNVAEAPFRLVAEQPLPMNQIITTTRIGISKSQATPWRFYIKDNPYVSKV